jgi:UDP-N-acetylglucosamine 1-carboxyvinyltransferase
VGKFVIRGGRPLSGRVRASGSKNAVLPMLSAAILNAEPCTVIDTPDLKDVEVMLDILRWLGAAVEAGFDPRSGRGTITVHARNLKTHEVDEHLMREMRSSIFLMGPLLGRLGHARVCYPGGCAIGPRPIDYHLRVLRALGARIEERAGFIYAEADRLVGCEVHLDFPSVGATENLIMAAVLAEGTTVVRNAAKEPEIVDLQNFLNAMGARVRGAGTDVIRVQGASRLGPAEHAVIPDRIEAGTFMVAAAGTGGAITIENVIPEHVEAVTAKLREAGVEVEAGAGVVHVSARGRVRAVDYKTLPYPGFPTDMQPQFMALASVADGTSIITETVFTNRFTQAEELRRMGASIKTEGYTAVVQGMERLSGATVTATDLRSGAALVVAGLEAEGVTTVENVIHVDRGYEALEVKLRGLGADIERIA